MTLPSRSSERSSITALNPPSTLSEQPGTYDALFRAICPQQPGKPRVERPPQIPLIAPTQRQTPVRPVYNDFATAHSSITSRSAESHPRDKLRRSPTKQRGLLDRGRPVPRRTKRSVRRQEGLSQPKKMSAPQTPKAAHHRGVSDFDFDVSEADFISTRPPQLNLSVTHPLRVKVQKRSSPSRFLGSLRRVLRSKSSPNTKTTQKSSISSLCEDSEVATELEEVELQPEEYANYTQKTGRASLELETMKRLHSQYLSNADEDLIHQQGQDAGLSPGDLFTQGCQDDNKDLSYGYNAGINSSPNDSNEVYLEHLKTPDKSSGGFARPAGSQANSSTREGSTVDNIVKQYARNDHLRDINPDNDEEDSEDSEELFIQARPTEQIRTEISGLSISMMDSTSVLSNQPGPLADIFTSEVGGRIRLFQLTESSGDAPNMVLPQIPSSADQCTLQSSSQGFGQSSSYGDTRNLLDITLQSLWKSPNTDSAGATAEAAESDQGLSTISDTENNAFPYDPAPTYLPPTVKIDSSPSRPPKKEKVDPTLAIPSSKDDVANTPRRTLERDISRALRRLSAFSSPSQEDVIYNQGDGGFQSSTDSGGLLSFTGQQDSRGKEIKKLAAHGFYHESAIRQTWLGSHHLERVRVPIARPFSVYSSLPAAHSRSSSVDEDGNDWETVLESGAASRAATNLNGTSKFKRAGSSLANTSDLGSRSPAIYKHSDFSSTDRIIQHPAQIEISHDYRYREIREGKFPVLLPSYQPHTVNGFPANSSRPFNALQSDGTSYQHPIPLTRHHTNPFKSSPPELLETKRIVGDSDDQKFSMDCGGLKTQAGTYSMLGMNGDASGNSMNESDDPEVMLGRLSGRPLLGTYSPSLTVGSSIADGSTSSLGLAIEGLDPEPQMTRWKADATDFVFTPASGVGTQRVLDSQSPLIKGPPGAFYQGVRSRPDIHRKGFSLDSQHAPKSPRRNTAYSYPTNQMRPLSLLKVHHAKWPTGSGEDSLLETDKGIFLYRSPLAPIKSSSWRDLYTRDQLSLIRNAARVDGIYDLESQTRRSSSRPGYDDSVKVGGPWKRLQISPQMFAWPRENSSVKSDLVGRKAKLSTIMFGMCCLFPPLLVLYGIGYMDNMMLWMTNGEISAFSKAHKRAALQVVLLFVVAVLVAVPITVALKVTGSRRT